jgi:hypothetical protein
MVWSDGEGFKLEADGVEKRETRPVRQSGVGSDVTPADETITAVGRTNGSSREWIYRVDNTRHDLDISGVLLHRDSRSVRPIVVGMPTHESGPPRISSTRSAIHSC